VETELSEYADLLYNMALLNSGFLIENPSDFTIPLQKLLKLGFGIRRDAPIEEIEIDISTFDEEEEDVEFEEPDQEGEVEEEDIRKKDDNEESEERHSH
jgi:heat shock protein beta